MSRVCAPSEYRRSGVRIGVRPVLLELNEIEKKQIESNRFGLK